MGEGKGSLAQDLKRGENKDEKKTAIYSAFAIFLGGVTDLAE